jgi:anti-anti-sigma factor
MSDTFEINLVPVKDRGNVRIVHIVGEVSEISLDDFRKEVDLYLKTDGVDIFIFFLKDLNFIESSVVTYFVNIFKQLGEDDKKMIMAEGNEQIYDILNVVGILNLVEYHNTIDEAIESLDF